LEQDPAEHEIRADGPSGSQAGVLELSDVHTAQSESAFDTFHEIDRGGAKPSALESSKPAVESLDQVDVAEETEESEAPQELVDEPMSLAHLGQDHEEVGLSESSLAEPEPPDPDDPDSLESRAETAPTLVEFEDEYLEPEDMDEPDDYLDDEPSTSLDSARLGASRPLTTAQLDQAPPPESSVLDDEVLDKGVGRWLWVDPRHEAGYRAAGFDLAGFLERAVGLFQSKAWTGGQRPGRLAVHPDEAGAELHQAAEELGLEVVPNPQVGLGTYRLALAEPPADAKT
jgi:hypothetical protein